MFALDRFAELVLVFAADGTSQLPFSIRDHQWPINQLEVFVGFFEAAQTLLLVDVSNFGESHLMAVNSGSRTVRWSTHLEKGGCWGIELLFTQKNAAMGLSNPSGTALAVGDGTLECIHSHFVVAACLKLGRRVQH